MPSGSPSVGNPANPGNHGGSTSKTPKKAPSEHDNAANPTGGGGQVGSAHVAVSADQDSQTTKQNSAVSAQELEELGDLQTKLQVRAETESSNVENLRKQMESGGNSLRSDVAASQSRMKTYMHKFDAALNAGDAEAARKFMGMAEHEVEFLESFFGH